MLRPASFVSVPYGQVSLTEETALKSTEVRVPPACPSYVEGCHFSPSFQGARSVGALASAACEHTIAVTQKTIIDFNQRFFSCIINSSPKFHPSYPILGHFTTTRMLPSGEIRYQSRKRCTPTNSLCSCNTCARHARPPVSRNLKSRGGWASRSRMFPNVSPTSDAWTSWKSTLFAARLHCRLPDSFSASKKRSTYYTRLSLSLNQYLLFLYCNKILTDFYYAALPVAVIDELNALNLDLDESENRAPQCRHLERPSAKVQAKRSSQ